MKTKRFHPVKQILLILLIISAVISIPYSLTASRAIQPDTLAFRQYRGSIIDAGTDEPLSYATIAVNGTNIVTISNTEGQFLLKVPAKLKDAKITVSYLGYENSQLNLSSFNAENNEIKLKVRSVSLHEVTVFPKNAELLIRGVMNRRNQNYVRDPMLMTAFYRETIRKRRTYVSLSEAVVEVMKQPINASRGDFAQLYKARKSTDYNKLDTVAFKLQGGPVTNLMLDIIKHPDLIFSDDMLGNYMFNIEDVTKIGDRYMYVLEFKQRPHITIPLYYGVLYIDTETLALTSATFNLNCDDRDAASQMFIKKKPVGARVWPTSASYHVDYRESNGKWYYGYSRGDLSFRVSWRKRLFNKVYDSSIEMLITDWERSADELNQPVEKVKPSIIMADDVSGFADPEFWGEYNVIEPEKPIESAIKKIQKNLEKKSK